MCAVDDAMAQLEANFLEFQNAVKVSQTVESWQLAGNLDLRREITTVPFAVWFLFAGSLHNLWVAACPWNIVRAVHLASRLMLVERTADLSTPLCYAEPPVRNSRKVLLSRINLIT